MDDAKIVQEARTIVESAFKAGRLGKENADRVLSRCVPQVAELARKASRERSIDELQALLERANVEPGVGHYLDYVLTPYDIYTAISAIKAQQ